MKLKWILLLISVFSVNLFAQSPDKILKQAEKALGGAKSLQAIQSLQEKGSISRVKDGASGQFLMQIAQPNLYNERFDLGGIESEIGYNGKSGWERNSQNGLHTITGNTSRDLAVEADFYNTRWLDYKKDKAKISNGGTADVNGKPAKIVILTSPKGVAIKMYFDSLTNLPVRQEFPSGNTIKILDFDDYRVVNAVKIPYLIQLQKGDEVYQIKLDEIKINQQIAKNEFDFPKISGETLPDITALLKSLYSNTDKKVELVENYSYNKKYVTREFDGNGNLKEKESSTYQISYYKGYSVYHLIEKNDKPLDEKEQKKADEEAQKSIENIDKFLAKKAEKEAKAAKENADQPKKETGNFYSEILKASNLINPRRERFRGRDVIVFDFEPNDKFDYKNAQTLLKFFGKTSGVIWIDEKDKEVVRMEAVLGESVGIGGGFVAKVNKGGSMILEQERVNDEVWLPSLQEVNASARVFLVKGMSLNQSVKTYNYQKFKTDVKDSKVDEIKQP